MRPKALVVLGPNSAGKSGLAVKLARFFDGEVVSADSRQVYKGLDVGCGKITEKEKEAVPHHLLDVSSPKRRFTVWQYQQKAYKAIDKILKRGKLPIIAGGSPFYIYAVTEGRIFPQVKPDLKFRKKLQKMSQKDLFSILKKSDPARAKNIDQKNKVRLVRALEIIKNLGVVPKMKEKPRYECLKIGLNFPEKVLRRKIAQRLKKRLKLGLIHEFKKLKAQGLSLKRMEELGLEYRWGAMFLKGLINKTELAAGLEKEIWNFSKRQMAWFKKDKEIFWVKNFQEAKALTRAFLK